jgi:hypothetical protein
MADINELVAKYVPKNDVGVPGENVSWDEKNDIIKVTNSFGTSLYDTSGNLLYGKGALYDTNIGSVTGENVQIFGRNEEIGLAESGDELDARRGNQARIERQRKEAAYAAGGTTGLVSYLNTGGVPALGTGLKTAEQIAADARTAAGRAERQSAYDLLYSEFDRYGLGSLVAPLKDLIISGASPSEFTIKLRETDAYKKRFAANQARIKNGLRALSEAEYIRNEDAYQEVMRRRGLPETYYSRGDMGIQKGFEALLAGDVSSAELEDRIVTAQDRVLNANPEIARTLKEFYPGISNGDILAYSLDPVNAINAIKRKITAAEIGTAAKQEGLTSGLSRAEELATMGVTGATAAQGYKTIGGGLQRGSQLAAIYGENPYSQVTAEQEIFNLQGAQEARKQRQKITGLEKATFGGQTGVTSGALARDRAGAY